MRTKTIKALPLFISGGVGSLLLSLLCLAGLPAHAADMDVPATASASARVEAPILVTLTQFKVGQDASGKPALLDAKVVLPGDVLEYRAIYKNQSTLPLSVAATLPVPEALEYLGDSATGKSGESSRMAHTVALKDSQFSAEPLMRKKVGADGATVTQVVPTSEYRYVRWNLEKLAPGASAEVTLRAKVLQNQEPLADATK
jgi:hypothetical protein